jgi:NADPH:quinone reductase-like Zn-dependent oxidoreductase
VLDGPHEPHSSAEVGGECDGEEVSDSLSVKAVTYDRYGPPEVLRLSGVDRPVPKDDELLVRVYATTATRSDCGLRSAEYFISRFFTGIFRPKASRRILGTEFAGEVESVGASVTEFEPGDRVFGIRSGSNAEYVCVREDGVIEHVPTRLSFAEAAAVADGALSAMSCLRQARVQAGKRVVVYGASGSIGVGGI